MLMNEKAIAAERDKRVQQVLSENRSWTRYKGLMEALDGNNTARANIAKTALLVMENQAKYMANVARDKRMEAVFTNALGTLVPKIIDLVRIFYPNLIAHKLVDIQPLDRQNGQIVLVRPVFDSSAGGVTAGQQVFQHVTDGTYASENSTAVVGTSNGSSTTISGSVSPVPMRPSTVRVTCGTVVGTDNGAGVISGTGVTGTVDYSSGAISVTYTVQPVASASVVAQFRYDSEQNTSQIRSLDIQITNLPIQAEPHPMKVTWSQQSQFAAESHYDLDMGDMLTNLVASFIKQERDMQLINQVTLNAIPEDSLNFDATPPTNYSKLARYAEIGIKLDYAESLIQADLGRGGVNWVLCGNNAANVWSQVSGFKPSGAVAPIGPYEIGTLRDGTVSVIKVPTMDANTYIVGFKGYVVGDSSIVLGEWIPLYATPVFQSPDLYNAAGMVSLYASVINQPKYFRRGTISGFTA